jgi:hypothetical protein
VRVVTTVKSSMGGDVPDTEGRTKADAETIPKTPLHAHGDGRREDIAGDTDKYLSGDHKQRQSIDDEESSKLGPPAPEKH